jgi:methylenetetrahydrofolate reductase (NADPH)
MKTGSKLERLLENGAFAVTAELGPPKGPDTDVVLKKIGLLRDACDAVNVTDNQTAIVRLSSVATSALLVQNGLEPVMQMTCRDRNRLAIQADLFGAVALGIRNVLCLTGDHQVFGNHKGSKNVYDLDSVQLIQMTKRLRDEGLTLGGDPVEGAMPFISAEQPILLVTHSSFKYRAWPRRRLQGPSSFRRSVYSICNALPNG